MKPRAGYADTTAPCETIETDEALGVHTAAGTGLEVKTDIQVPAEVPEGVAEAEADIGIMRPAEEDRQGNGLPRQRTAHPKDKA